MLEMRTGSAGKRQLLPGLPGRNGKIPGKSGCGSNPSAKGWVDGSPPNKATPAYAGRTNSPVAGVQPQIAEMGCPIELGASYFDSGVYLGGAVEATPVV